MKTQSSFQGSALGGTLYVVPTPIGNLEDITMRAIKTLKAVEVIAAEDTRNTRKLLNYFEINKSLISYHEHNKESRESGLIEMLKEGKDIALVSDAGMPAISDPGYDIVHACVEEDIHVVVLPGASAALCALVGSGLPTSEFYFYGFLPRKKKVIEEELSRLQNITATILFYESPHRLGDTLKHLQNQFGERRITVARELTKRYEEYIRGTIAEVAEWANTGRVKGECCIVMEGTVEQAIEQDLWWSNLSIEQHVDHYIKTEEMRSKDAIKQVSKDRDLSKREVYQTYHVDS